MEWGNAVKICMQQWQKLTNIGEIIYTTIYNKNINGKDDPSSSNFSNYTEISLLKRFRKKKIPQFSPTASITYYWNAFLT